MLGKFEKFLVAKWHNCPCDDIWSLLIHMPAEILKTPISSHPRAALQPWCDTGKLHGTTTAVLKPVGTGFRGSRTRRWQVPWPTPLNSHQTHTKTRQFLTVVNVIESSLLLIVWICPSQNLTCQAIKTHVQLSELLRIFVLVEGRMYSEN